MTENGRDARRARSAQRILAAAQEEFALHGYDGATIRAIAARAGVDASLVMQHYGSKGALFKIAVELPTDDAQAASEHLADVLSVRLAGLPPETRALVRSMLTVPEAEAAMRDFLQERIDNLAGSLEGEDAEVRAVLAVCGILGMTVARHFLRLPSFERVSAEDLAHAASSWAEPLPPGRGRGEVVVDHGPVVPG